MMSSKQIVCRLQAHADVKLPDKSLYHRNSLAMLRLLTCTAQSLLIRSMATHWITRSFAAQLDLLGGALA
jgi:hypothetical protein